MARCAESGIAASVRCRVARLHDQPSGLLAPASTAQADVLSDVLRTVKLTGALFFRVEASPPWADAVPAAAVFGDAVLPGAQHVVSYHIVTRGSCWARVGDGPDVRLQTGDVFVVPHGDPYVMSSAPGLAGDAPPDAVLSFFRMMATASAPAVVVEGGAGDGTDPGTNNARIDLVCGFLGCDLRPFNPVLEALPRLVHLPAGGGGPDRLAPLIEFALAESRTPRSGTQCVLLRLSEVLFVEVVRRYLDGLPDGHAGWLAGLRDPLVGHALALLHERPGDAWTLNLLARRIGVSRSALAERFTAIVGQPPMRYLTRWRMQTAARLLADGAPKIAALAGELGYESEAAFSRAFKKIVGTPPAAWRRRA